MTRKKTPTKKTTKIVPRSKPIEELPIHTARLPEAYVAAKMAIAKCASIDECTTWKNKAHAMASYARQAQDETLRKHAERIQARAVRRCGELMRSHEPQQGKRTDKLSEPGRTKLDPPSRKALAESAGLSKHQARQATTIARIPTEDFDYAVESQDGPPTLKALAQMGTVSKPKPLFDLEGIPPADFKLATECQGTLRQFAKYCEANDPERIAKAFKPHELDELREWIGIVDGWLDRFIINLIEEKK